MMQKSFYVESKNAKKLQDIVKSTGLRFDFFTHPVGGKHYVQISGPVEDMNEFSCRWYQLTTNIRECYRKPSLKVKVRKFFRKVLALRKAA